MMGLKGDTMNMLNGLMKVNAAIKDAIENDRMGKDPDFAKFINEELTMTLLQKFVAFLPHPPKYMKQDNDEH